EIDAANQIKLLRVLPTRTFQRLGDTQNRKFTGKIIAATNRDLAQQMQLGQIREDFYYRLCSDMITTPSLQDILRQSPDELHNMILFIAQRVTAGAADIHDSSPSPGTAPSSTPKPTTTKKPPAASPSTAAPSNPKSIPTFLMNSQAPPDRRCVCSSNEEIFRSSDNTDS